jgi:hypothetical protein
VTSEEPRLSEKVELDLRTVVLALPPHVSTAFTRIVDRIVQHVEALENVTPVEVVTETRTAKGPPGPTTFGASP